MKWLIGLCGLWGLPLLMLADVQAAERGSGVVRCESKDMARVHCDMDTEHGVQLVRQLSGTSCIRGSEWDIERDGVWVEQGCRAEFASARVLAAPQMRRVVRCDSNGSKVACPVILRGAPVRLLRQRSVWPCKEGRSWGTRRNEIWSRVGAMANSKWAPRMAPASSTCRAPSPANPRAARAACAGCRWSVACACASRSPARRAWKGRPGAGAAMACGSTTAAGPSSSSTDGPVH